MGLKELVALMRRHADKEYHGDEWLKVNDEKWTLADLYIRQWLNNGCDGFGMTHVGDIYDVLVEHKDLLIANDMVSKDARNNSGFPLWNDYNY